MSLRKSSYVRGLFLLFKKKHSQLLNLISNPNLTTNLIPLPFTWQFLVSEANIDCTVTAGSCIVQINAPFAKEEISVFNARYFSSWIDLQILRTSAFATK